MLSLLVTIYLFCFLHYHFVTSELAGQNGWLQAQTEVV